ncbi:hypothetical protein HKX48_002018, partial [Thoreauomyces humboldtii]
MIEFDDHDGCERFWDAVRVGDKWTEQVRSIEVEKHAGVRVMGVQRNPPNWGLDRIDQIALPLNGLYQYPENGGRNIDIYIVDTGINIYHEDFGGRASWGTSTSTTSTANYDDNGHGSHVAGIAAGTTYGCSKYATLIAVKSLGADGSGPFTDVIDGLSWVGNTASASGRDSIINLSIQGDDSTTFNDALTGVIGLGIHVVAAAGNAGDDACAYSPPSITRTTSVIAVGATDNTDTVPNFSNYGACVSLVAPGVNIVSVRAASFDGSISMTGTSMASPHVAGTLANLLSSNNTDVPRDPAGLKRYILSGASIATGVANVTRGRPDGVLHIDGALDT